MNLSQQSPQGSEFWAGVVDGAPHEETSSQRLKNKQTNKHLLPLPSHPQGECSAADFRLLCNSQGRCQNATAMSHGTTLQPNTSPRGMGEPTRPLYIAAAVMSHAPAKVAGFPSSCLVKKS